MMLLPEQGATPAESSLTGDVDHPAAAFLDEPVVPQASHGLLGKI